MIIDYVVSLGHFAFRRVLFNDPKSLLSLMDKVKVDMGVVSSLESIMYRNVQSGNELLAERLAGFRERLLPAAVINPAYPEAIEDLEYCIHSLDMKAVKLYPLFHGYKLTDEIVAAVLRECSDEGIPVSISLRVEDERQRHWLVNIGEAWGGSLPTEGITPIIKKFSNVNFVLERFSWEEFSKVYKESVDCQNYYVEISGRFMHGTPSNHIKQLIQLIGAERVLLGTDMPLQYPQAALLKIETIDPPLNEKDKRMILGENAARLLKLKV